MKRGRFDIRVKKVSVDFGFMKNRIPLKFGHEVTTDTGIARVQIEIEDREGRTCVGTGETPIAVAWTWPSTTVSHAERQARMIGFIQALVGGWSDFQIWGHPMEIGYSFISDRLHPLLAEYDSGYQEHMPYLAALVCNASFDIALYDAYGTLWKKKAFDIFTPEYMNHDLSWYFNDDDFEDEYPDRYLVPRDQVPKELIVWHLVGGLDPLEEQDLQGDEPDDGYPVLLRDWIARDGLLCLKIKLRGNDSAWDFNRIVKVGCIALETGVQHLSVDFNCTVHDPGYVIDILDRLKSGYPEIFDLILYVEQPFPYEIEKFPIDVHELAGRKLLMMDESAHDWHFVKLGIDLGWNGVALKSCKTITGAVLMLCYARKHGMRIMVQDLTNPKLAMIPHVLLAANAGTIMGVEANSMQFCPEASAPEARIHPGLFQRRNGHLDLSTIGPYGMGYRLEEIEESR